MSILLFAGAQRDADKGTAAVANHDSDSQGDYCHRKNDRIGSVAVGTEIAGIGYKELVHNVVERRHQQGNHARHRIFPHQTADWALL